MDKQKINTDHFPATQSDGDAATQSNEDEAKDKYSSQAQNQTSFKDFMVICSQVPHNHTKLMNFGREFFHIRLRLISSYSQLLVLHKLGLELYVYIVLDTH